MLMEQSGLRVDSENNSATNFILGGKDEQPTLAYVSAASDGEPLVPDNGPGPAGSNIDETETLPSLHMPN